MAKEARSSQRALGVPAINPHASYQPPNRIDPADAAKGAAAERAFSRLA
jgi:hypothetical protein